MDSIQAAGTASKCIGCLCTLGCCAAQVTLIVYLGIFAFNNPDKDSWYGVDANGEGALFAKEAEATTTGDTELEDIHGKFVLWFLWGFIMALAPCAAAPVLALANCIHEMVGKVLGGIVSCGMACGGLAWWISGIVWRFKASGSFAAGDALTEAERAALPEDPETLYQYRSGNFMLIYYIIVWSLMGCSVLTSLIGLIATCTCMKG
jgi:hypothetical protein